MYSPAPPPRHAATLDGVAIIEPVIIYIHEHDLSAPRTFTFMIIVRERRPKPSPLDRTLACRRVGTCKIMSDAATGAASPSAAGSAPAEGGVAAQAGASADPDTSHDSEPLKKKQRKNRSSMSKIRGRRGALKAFNSLPLDLVLDICSYLDPADLYVLSNTSKVFRAVVTGPSSAQLWIDARARVGLPELELPMTDLQYAALLFGRGCQFCDRKNAGKPEVYFRARICSACFKSEYVLRGPFASISSLPLKLICVPAPQLRLPRNTQEHPRYPEDPPSSSRRHNPPCGKYEPA